MAAPQAMCSSRSLGSAGPSERVRSARTSSVCSPMRNFHGWVFHDEGARTATSIIERSEVGAGAPERPGTGRTDLELSAAMRSPYLLGRGSLSPAGGVSRPENSGQVAPKTRLAAWRDGRAAAHVGAERPGDRDAPVGVLVVFEDGDQHTR